MIRYLKPIQFITVYPHPMETITLICEILQKTLLNLTDSINRLQMALKNQDDKAITFNTLQDSILKRFDLYYIYSLKYGAALLKSHFQITLRIRTPKKIFNTLYQKQLIAQKELDILLATVRIKSLSKKCYDPKSTARAIHVIIEALPVIQKVTQKIVHKK